MAGMQVAVVAEPGRIQAGSDRGSKGRVLLGACGSSPAFSIRERESQGAEAGRIDTRSVPAVTNVCDRRRMDRPRCPSCPHPSREPWTRAKARGGMSLPFLWGYATAALRPSGRPGQICPGRGRTAGDSVCGPTRCRNHRIQADPPGGMSFWGVRQLANLFGYAPERLPRVDTHDAPSGRNARARHGRLTLPRTSLAVKGERLGWPETRVHRHGGAVDRGTLRLRTQAHRCNSTQTSTDRSAVGGVGGNTSGEGPGSGGAVSTRSTMPESSSIGL